MKNKNSELKKYNPAILKLFEAILKLDQEQQARLLRYAEELSVQDMRTSVRKICNIPVSFSAQNRINLDPIKNISKGGLFIETTVPLKAGDEILMSFNMQGYDRPLKIKGVVVRINPLGIGVEYNEISPYITEMIDTLVKRLDG